ncbi:15147_t:CDS:1, partial [Gigaspora margarita]
IDIIDTPLRFDYKTTTLEITILLTKNLPIKQKYKYQCLWEDILLENLNN